MSDTKSTPGPWDYDGDDSVASQDWEGDGYEIFSRDSNGDIDEPIGTALTEEDARLIAEAGTVAHETGMTPRQLQAENERLRAVNAALLEALRLILPLAKGYAAQNRVGSNDEYIRISESAIAAAKGSDQ